jgi:nitrite reductase (NO-forming)
MRRSRRLLLSVVAVLALGVLAVVVVALAGGFDRKAIRERVRGGGTHVVSVALVDRSLGFDADPNTITVDRRTHLILNVVNDGKERHDLAAGGRSPRTRMLDPGESQRLDLGTVTHDMHVWCTLPGHKLFGMSLAILVAHTSPGGGQEDRNVSSQL